MNAADPKPDLTERARRVLAGVLGRVISRDDVTALGVMIRRSDDPTPDPHSGGGDGWICYPDPVNPASGQPCPKVQRRNNRLRWLRLVEHAPVRDYGTCGRAWWRPTDLGREVHRIATTELAERTA